MVKIIKGCSEEDGLIGRIKDIAACQEVLRDFESDLEDVKDFTIASLCEPYTEKALKLLVEARLVLTKVDKTYVEFICDNVDKVISNEVNAMYFAREYKSHKPLDRIVNKLGYKDIKTYRSVQINFFNFLTCFLSEQK